MKHDETNNVRQLEVTEVALAKSNETQRRIIYGNVSEQYVFCVIRHNRAYVQLNLNQEISSGRFPEDLSALD